MTKLVAAATFGITGELAGFAVYFAHFTGPGHGKGWGSLLFLSGIASASIALLLWAPLAGRTPSCFRGVLVGVTIALLAYPITWYLFSVMNWLQTFGTAEHEQILSPLTAVPASLLYGALGVFLTGWMTLPIAAATGLGLSLFQTHVYSKADTPRPSSEEYPHV